MSGSTNDYSVSSFASLSTDIGIINGETAPGTYTIDITGDISLTGALPDISLASGVTLDIAGNGFTLDGGGAEAGLFAYQGTVSIDELTLLNTTITGGEAPDGLNVGGTGYAGYGGGSAGLGGGLFVGSKATVTLDHVNFTNDGAIGGAGNIASSQAGQNARAGLGQGGSGGNQGAAAQVGGNGQSGGFGGGGGGGGGGGSGYFFNTKYKHTGTVAGEGGAGGKGGFGAGNGASGLSGVTLNVTVSTYRSTFTNSSGKHVLTHTSHHSSGTPNPYYNGGGAGGGGLGAGGDIFVQGGGKLKILGGSLGAGTVKGGTGPNPGSSFGSGMFLQGNEEVTFAPAAGKTLTIAGVIADEAGSEASYSAVQGSVVIDGSGTVILEASNSFTGGVYIADGTLVLEAPSAAGGGDIVFTNNLVTDPKVSFTVADTPTEALVNFGAGDVLDVTDLSEASVAQKFVTDSSGGGTLTLTGTQIGSGDPETVTLVFSNYQGPFAVIPDAGGGTEIIPICYVRGTNILTPVGNVPVESLQIGDALVTRFGGIRPVKWIGRQSFDARFLRNSPAKRPVRIRAGALAAGMPARDLLVSPGHALLLGDVLVLASRLVNGVTILREQITGETLDYFQIEFASHDCVIAEGSWAESYADAPGQRAQFHNAGDFSLLYPDDAPPDELNLCAPRPERGARLQAALLPVAARAAAGITPGPLEGYVDMADDWHVHGWALDTAHPELPVLLEVLLDDETLGSVLAFEPRDDLRAEGKGSGDCAFVFTAPRRLPADALPRLTVRRAADGVKLPLTGFAPGAPAPLRIVA
jgi:autotransporter-associated beta strand protein